LAVAIFSPAGEDGAGRAEMPPVPGDGKTTVRKAYIKPPINRKVASIAAIPAKPHKVLEDFIR